MLRLIRTAYAFFSEWVGELQLSRDLQRQYNHELRQAMLGDGSALDRSAPEISATAAQAAVDATAGTMTNGNRKRVKATH